MQYITYFDAQRAAVLMREITGITYLPVLDKTGAYDLRSNLSYPIAPRATDSAFHAKSIVPANPNDQAQNQPAASQRAVTPSPNPYDAKLAPANPPAQGQAVKAQAVRAQVGQADQPNLYIPPPPPFAPITVPPLPVVTAGPSALNGATGVGSYPASPQPAPPVGRVAVPVAFPQYQAGGGASGEGAGTASASAQPQVQFPLTPSPGSGTIASTPGFTTANNNVSASSRIGLIVDVSLG
ncbi:MAG: hypothetical protein QM537_04355 [Candidatus Symbiobacter sp.]|nr:hypothetical protein [Candidatus Symbiobacter sp.]